MPVLISMLRGVNVGGNNLIKMDALKALYESLKLKDVRTHIQSGNVVFRTEEKDLVSLAKRIEKTIEKNFGFRPEVIIRTLPEMKAAIAKNPFADRNGIDPRKLLVTFLGGDPSLEGREKVLAIKAEPEELRLEGREVYIYYANGIARPKISWISVVKMLKTEGTGRNWNTVTKLAEIAESLENQETKK